MLKLLENYIGTFQYIALIKLVFAFICGGIVGLERGLKGRPAGIKTFSLVCVGATLAMITNEYITLVSGGSGDSARMAAQVISGIGFLGAGTIMITGSNQIKGLTTAAALWVNASIGITIGAGFYFGAIATTFLVITSSYIFKLVDKLVISNSKYMKISVELTNEEFIVNLIDFCLEREINIQSIVRNSENKLYKQDICVILELKFKKRNNHEKFLEELKILKEIRFAEEC